MTRRFVITGTGHSGTAWLALACSMAGLPTTHEGVFTLRGPMPWPPGLAGDVSLAAAPHLDALTDTATVLVVRDPLAVVNSFMRGYTFARHCPCHPNRDAHRDSPFVKYLCRYASLDRHGDDELGATIRYVIEWIAMARPRAVRFRLEDLAAGDTDDFAATIGADPATMRGVVNGPWLTKNVNAHGGYGDRPDLTWADIDAQPLGERLHDLALNRLGYR